MIPLAEEYLWRGVIQPRLVAAWSFAPAGVVTAMLFSLKHAIVDASLGRLLTIMCFGLVMGVYAARSSWRASAVAHAFANLIATSVAILIG